jgi:hypothetical protein
MPNARLPDKRCRVGFALRSAWQWKIVAPAVKLHFLEELTTGVDVASTPHLNAQSKISPG